MIVKGGSCAGPVHFIGVSMPRSGHHFFVRLFQELFKNDLFYCEYYEEPDCCQEVPCLRRGSSPITFQKNHDFDVDVTRDATDSIYLIQHRMPVPAVLSAREFYARELYGDEVASDRGEYAVWLGRNAAYYLAFSQRWLLDPPANSMLVDYDDLAGQPKEVLARVLRLAQIETTNGAVDEAVAAVIPRAGRFGEHAYTPRSIDNSRFADHELLALYESIIVAELPHLAPRRALAPVEYRDSLIWRVIEARRAWRAGHPETALRLVDRAIEDEPNNALLFHERAEVARALGQLRASQSALVTAATLAPSHPLILGGLITVSAMLGDEETARGPATRLMELTQRRETGAAHFARSHIGDMAVAADIVAGTQRIFHGAPAETSTPGDESRQVSRTGQPHRPLQDDGQHLDAIRRLRSQVAKLEAELQQKQLMVADLTAVADERRRLCESLDAEAARSRDAAKYLTGALLEKEAAIDELAAANARLTDSLREKEGVMAELATAAERLTVDLVGKEAAIREKEGEIAELATAAEDRLRLIETLDATLRAHSVAAPHSSIPDGAASASSVGRAGTAAEEPAL